MSQPTVIQKVTATTTEEALRQINDNFKALTERIKNVNLQISYLDLLNISQIYTVTDGEGSDTNEQRVRAFVAQCWNLLQNYNGVYISGGPVLTSSGCLFTWMGNPVNNGDFIIKLPNNESLVIPTQAPKYYVPTTYNAASGIIEYELNDQSSNDPISTPVIQPGLTNLGYVTTITVGSGATATVPGTTCVRIDWYTLTGERVFIPDDSTTNTTNMTLNAVMVLQTAPNP